MPKPQLEFFNAADVKGEEVFPKVIEQLLSHDKETGNHTKIQFLMPGFKGDGAYGHDYWEEIYILSGSGHCGTADKWLKAGDYACRAPGMIHGPFTIPEDGEPLKALLINTYSWSPGTGPPAAKE